MFKVARTSNVLCLGNWLGADRYKSATIHHSFTLPSVYRPFKLGASKQKFECKVRCNIAHKLNIRWATSNDEHGISRQQLLHSAIASTSLNDGVGSNVTSRLCMDSQESPIYPSRIIDVKLGSKHQGSFKQECSRLK